MRYKNRVGAYAGRQAFLVVTEPFFLSERNQKIYFVITSYLSGSVSQNHL